MSAVILYGPPAVGKDTVTAALTELDDSYRLYQRLKAGSGRTTGYRMATPSRLDAIRSAGDAIWENCRYDAVYVVDRPSLADMLLISTPILHLGQVEAVKAVTDAMPATQWMVVWLWCPRDVATRRITERDTGDTTARLLAWDETEPLPNADLSINTAEVRSADAATMIHSRVLDLYRSTQ